MTDAPIARPPLPLSISVDFYEDRKPHDPPPRVVCVTPGVETVQRGFLRGIDEFGHILPSALVALDPQGPDASPQPRPLWRHTLRYVYHEAAYDKWKLAVHSAQPKSAIGFDWRDTVLPSNSKARKEYPIVTGCMDYFPAAIAEVARLSYLANEKHNPGEPLHHSRNKSGDHDDCLGRHTLERGKFEVIAINDVDHYVLHSVCRAWRAMAAAQIELEEVYGRPKARAAR